MDNSYIHSLLQDRPQKGAGAADRRAWSIPVFGVWVPFFTATNATGESHISAEALGYPVRLAKDTDGTPKFGKSGRPILRAVKELSDQVRIVRENFVSGLKLYADNVAKDMPTEYGAQVALAQAKGEFLAKKDITALEAYLAATRTPAEATVPTDEKVLVPA